MLSTACRRGSTPGLLFGTRGGARRIRVALDKAFKLIGLPLKATDVLSTETYEDKSEPPVGMNSQLISKAGIKAVAIDSLLPYSERSECYRLKAKAYIEHVP